MSDMMMNLAGQVTQTQKNDTTMAKQKSKSTGSAALSMDNFYQLMAAQLKNQDMQNPSDSGEFLNQMIQMAVVQTIDTINTTSITTYAASLVGKDVSVAEVGENNTITEVAGKVTATGLYAGEQIIFVNDKSYKLSQLMAIGKLPEKVVEKPVVETPIVEEKTTTAKE